MIITIEGKQGEGKTTLVQQMLEGRKAVFTEERLLGYKDWLLELDDDVEFLVVDEVIEIEAAKIYLSNKSSRIRRPYAETMIDVKLPANIILIKQSQ